MATATPNTTTATDTTTQDVKTNDDNATIPTKTNDNNNILNISTPTFIIPEKSPSDPRDYKIIKLSNDLECMLVSDPDAEKAACAMAVRVGHFADPDTLPGLAHFLEHMLFLGTKKYPNEAEYKQFLKDHGGSSNASTGMHDTCFQFDVGSEYLLEAIDRFAQFFISPLFTASATDRELNAVNSENSNNQQSDGHRLYQFDKSLANSNHPFHKFGTGNINTLKLDVPSTIDVREELLAFHRKYYSSSTMKLSIVGKQNIDVLSDYVINTFSLIKNQNIIPPKYNTNAFNIITDDIDAKNDVYLYKIVPIKERRELRLNFPMDSCYSHTLSQPTSLLSFCLGDEGTGSILAYLKSKGYATGLCAGLSYNVPEFSMMQISVSLTPEGIQNYTQIVEIIFKYIYKMKLLTDNEWNQYFEERAKVRQMNFNFKGKEKSYGYSRSLAISLHKNYPRNLLLKCQNGLLFKYDFNLIQKYLNYLNVSNCYYQLISTEFKDECKETETWYGTQYKTIKIDQNLLKRWKDALYNINNDKLLYTPPANKYIADDFTICCDDNKDNDNDNDNNDLPFVIRETDESKIWFKMDQTFRKPKLCVSIKLISPDLNNSIINSSLTTLIFLIFNDSLSDSTYRFEEASLHFSAVYGGSDSIIFKFGGYNQKLYLLMDTVLNEFANLKISKQSYEIQKEKLYRIIVSMKKSQPYTHCDMIDTLFLCPKSLSLDELETAYNNITYDAVLKQYTNIFNKLYCETLLYGNINKTIALDQYTHIIDKYLINSSRSKYLLNDIYSSKKGCLKLTPSANYYIQFKCPNNSDENSCISNNYLYKNDTLTDFALIKLFAHLINAPCFDQLRTKEQLGYIVWSFNDVCRGFISFRVMVQSNNSDPYKLNERIELFLLSFRDYINNIDDNKFNLNKESLINNLLEKNKTIAQQNAKYWREISNLRYQFEREQNLAKKIEKLNKNDILNFYNTYIDKNSNQRCKLSVGCFGNKHNIKTDIDDDNDKVNWNIKDVYDVRQKCGYYPYPYTDNTSKL